MQIGFVTQETIKDGDKEVAWLKMTIRTPFLRQQDFKLSKNNNKQKDNEPDYFIYVFINGKGESFRSLKVGAAWIKTGKESGEPYLSANIEAPSLPNGKIYLAITKAKPLFEGEKITWLYDVLWSADRKQDDKDQTRFEDTSGYTMTADEVASLQQEADYIFG